MKKIYLFGSNSIARLLLYYLQQEGAEVAGFALNKDYINPNLDLPLPVFAIEEIIANQNPEDYEVYVTIGEAGMNAVRGKVLHYLKEHKVHIGTFIHKTATVAQNASIGEGCIIMENCVIQPFVRLGMGNILWDSVTISHDSVVGDCNIFTAGATLCGCVTIGNRCFIGANATVKNAVTVADRCLIGAGAYLYTDLPNEGSVFVPQRGIILEKTSEFFIK